jgi:hypothetical protein
VVGNESSLVTWLSGSFSVPECSVEPLLSNKICVDN